MVVSPDKFRRRLLRKGFIPAFQARAILEIRVSRH